MATRSADTHTKNSGSLEVTEDPFASRMSLRSAVGVKWMREVAMLRKRKEPKARTSILETLMRDMQGSAAQKLALFAAGGFVNASATEVLRRK
jgi:hypothetical protein